MCNRDYALTCAWMGKRSTPLDEPLVLGWILLYYAEVMFAGGIAQARVAMVSWLFTSVFLRATPSVGRGVAGDPLPGRAALSSSFSGEKNLRSTGLGR